MITDQVCPTPGHRRMLEALSDAVLLIDPLSQRIIYVNCKAHELMGISTDEKELQGSASDVIATSPIGLIEGLESLLSRGEGCLSVPAGESIGPFLAKARPFVDGGRCGTMLTIENDDRSIDTKLELDHLRREQDALLDTIPDLIFSADRSGTIVSVNRAVRDLGYNEDDVIGENMSSFISPHNRVGYLNQLEDIFSGKDPEQDRPMEVIAKGGCVHLLKVRSRLVKVNGIPTEVQFITRDIPPAKEVDMAAFKRLELEKHFGETIIDFAESLIIVMDMEGTITVFNRMAEQTSGMQRQDVLGKNYFTILDSDGDPEAGKAWLAEMAKGRHSMERIRTLPGKHGNPLIWWHNTVVQSGDQPVMVGVGVDITERVSLNNRLEELNESLLLLNRIMCHDIMNDLNVALGSLQMFGRKREDRFIEAATRSVIKSVDMINDISDLERLRKPTDLRSIKVREVIDKVVESRAGQNVLVRVSGEAMAMADETLFSVIDNLIGNAIMHGHTDAVDIEICSDKGQCLIRVADHGKGISSDIKARIFEEGFKYGDTGNTGFGLYIVKKTMERFGGSVAVKDNKPQGAVFELRLLSPVC
jgi:PAS domain S-box-containing protein